MKRWIAALLICLFAVQPVTTYGENDALAGTESLSAAVLMEQQTSTRLWASNADGDCAVAGLSKLPALLTLAQSMDEGAIDPLAGMSVSSHAASIPGPTAFLDGGETVAANELMKAAVMISAGDAIMTLGENAYGSESVFVENINITMRQLGLTKTVIDAVGSGLKLTAWELATLGKAAAESKTFTQYCTLYMDSITHADGRETELVNANRLINNYAGCSGLMTGSSADDGYCGVFYAKRNGTNLIAVVVGAADAGKRTVAATALLDFGFSGFRTETLVKAGTPVVEAVPVRNGDVKSVDLVPRETVTIVLQSASGKLKKVFEAPSYLEAPLDINMVVCEVAFTGEDGNTVAAVPLYPAKEVAAFGIGDILLRIMAIFCA